jgi:hypothetical protein
VLQALDLDIIKCFKQFERKHMVLEAVCLIDCGKDMEMDIDVLQAVHLTVETW